MNLTGFENVNFEIPFSLRCRGQELTDLLKGRNRPLVSQEIERQLGICGAELRSLVSYLRVVEKQPIASGGKGYSWARDHRELQTTIHHMKERGVKDLQVAAALESIYAHETQERLL